MNFVYLSPHFPPNYYQFCVRLNEFGANVLGLADAPYESLRPELKGALTDYYRVADMHRYDQLVRAMGYFTHRHGKLDRIDSQNEYWLETEAALRTDFNLFGLKRHEIMDVKRKSRMKEIYRSAGIPVPRGAIVGTLEDGKRLAAEVGYPMVAKPDVGVGATATWKIHDEGELAAFLTRKPPVDYILEEFVPGQIFSFDGLTDREGNIVFHAAHAYAQGIMETVNDDMHVFYYSFREIPADLEAMGRRTAKAFNVRERFFHFEFFRNSTDNGIVALEVNMRPPGGLTTDMFNYANNIDIYREWARVVVHNRFEASFSRPYHCCYVGRKEGKRYAHTVAEVVHRFGPAIVHHEVMDSIFRAAIGDYGFLVRSAGLEEIMAAVRFIHQLA